VIDEIPPRIRNFQRERPSRYGCPLSTGSKPRTSPAQPTGWNALYGIKPLKLGGVVLTQWIGDASIFAVQVAKAAGATAIATTSPAKKVSVLKKLGAGTWLFERRRYLSNPLFSCWLRMGC
jgi:hypothetical protein